MPPRPLPLISQNFANQTMPMPMGQMMSPGPASYLPGSFVPQNTGYTPSMPPPSTAAAVPFLLPAGTSSSPTPSIVPVAGGSNQTPNKRSSKSGTSSIPVVSTHPYGVVQDSSSPVPKPSTSPSVRPIGGSTPPAPQADLMPQTLLPLYANTTMTLPQSDPYLQHQAAQSQQMVLPQLPSVQPGLQPPLLLSASSETYRFNVSKSGLHLAVGRNSLKVFCRDALWQEWRHKEQAGGPKRVKSFIDVICFDWGVIILEEESGDLVKILHSGDEVKRVPGRGRIQSRLPCLSSE